LKLALSSNLPGAESQLKLAPVGRSLTIKKNDNVRHAATMLAIYQKENSWFGIFIKRSGHPLDKHKGQISFPGGSLDEDEGSFEAAVREAHEEVGIEPEQITFLGKLSPLYIPVSNFQVEPYVGLVDIDKLKLIPQESEVESILHFNLSQFSGEEKILKKDITTSSGFTINNVPHYFIEGHVVWGATAMMMSEFIDIFDSVSKS
jgi:8-oxo-dGTP pyrophosphatase MutT (NUDIX family)